MAPAVPTQTRERQQAVGPASDRAAGALLNTPPALNSHRLLLRPAYRSFPPTPPRRPPLPTRATKAKAHSAATQTQGGESEVSGHTTHSLPCCRLSQCPLSLSLSPESERELRVERN
jgi:hypothetical protein